MAVNSQFLFFYIDELIKRHWVDWLEGPLSKVPAEEHKGLRGFQEAIGDTGAGPRTRAGEAYQLGILTGRIVRPQAAGAGFPSGWQSVIDGIVPSTKLGFYSYIIGKALRENPDDPNLERALDCLASILVLHIGFQHEGRWFNTALIYQFAHDQLSSQLERALTSDELRYLAAAVINTLDSDERPLLLDPYHRDETITGLRFDLSDGSTIHFDLSELPQIADDKEIGVNEFEKTKAALFWANPSRGIYTRAARSPGINLLREMIRVDQSLAQGGKDNTLKDTLDAIRDNAENPGLYSIAEKSFADFPGLMGAWLDLDSELFDATNKAAEAVELATAPQIWITAQQEIRGSKPEADEEPEAKQVEEIAADVTGNVIEDEQPAESPEQAASKKPKPRRLELPSQEALQEIVASDFDALAEAAPATKEPKHTGGAKPAKTRASKTNFAEREARNRKLGESGEFFIYSYEIQKLTAAGEAELASRVKWVSKELGDGLGYDIRSFEPDGSEIFLEVKTTTGGRATPFFVSNNEVMVSGEKGDSYRLIRVFNFPDQPRFFTLSGDLTEVLQLEPTSFRARVV